MKQDFPTRKGQKYVVVGQEANILTIHGFHGADGIIYDTYLQAYEKNVNKSEFFVVSAEYRCSDSILKMKKL